MMNLEERAMATKLREAFNALDDALAKTQNVLMEAFERGTYMEKTEAQAQRLYNDASALRVNAALLENKTRAM